MGDGQNHLLPLITNITILFIFCVCCARFYQGCNRTDKSLWISGAQEVWNVFSLLSTIDFPTSCPSHGSEPNIYNRPCPEGRLMVVYPNPPHTTKYRILIGLSTKVSPQESFLVLYRFSCVIGFMSLCTTLSNACLLLSGDLAESIYINDLRDVEHSGVTMKRSIIEQNKKQLGTRCMTMLF